MPYYTSMRANAKRDILLIVLIIVGSAVSFTLFTRLEQGPSPAPERYPVLEQDSSDYALLADNLLLHHTFSDSSDLIPFRKWAIGYPLFLAATKYVSGGFLLAIILQVLASIGAALLLYRMAQAFLPPHYALIPALLFSLDPYVLFLNTSILSDGLFTSLIIGIVYLLFFWQRQKSLRYFFGTGALLGVVTLIRPIAQFLIILLPLLYLWVNRSSVTHVWRFCAAFILGFAVIVTPWIIRNAVTFGTPEIAHISSFDLLYYDAQSFLLLKELRTIRPQPILLSSAPLYTPEAQAASARVAARITADLAALTPQGADPENYYSTLGMRYILSDPFYYGYFHIINTLPFFLQGDVRGYEVQARSIAARNGTVSAPVSLFEAVHTLKSRAASLETRAHALLTLLPSALELAWNVALILFSLLALVYGRRNRLLLSLAALVIYFAILTGPVGIDTPRLHIPAEPFLFLMAAIGVMGASLLAKHLYGQRVQFARFLISGTLATAIDIGLLYAGTEFLHVHYLVAASLALVVAYTISFFLQKLWAFGDRDTAGTMTQAASYAVFVLCSITMNALLLWFFVHELFLWYIAAQIVVSVLIALVSYVVYKTLLFGRTAGQRATSPGEGV
jgi:putative flippase GtrA